MYDLPGPLHKACQQGGQRRKRRAANIQVLTTANNGELTCLHAIQRDRTRSCRIGKHPRHSPCFPQSCRSSLPHASMLHVLNFTPFVRLHPLCATRIHNPGIFADIPPLWLNLQLPQSRIHWPRLYPSAATYETDQHISRGYALSSLHPRTPKAHHHFPFLRLFSKSLTVN
jgi:hypothetical protein